MLHSLSAGVHYKSSPEFGNRSVGRESPGFAQGVELHRELLLPHRRSHQSWEDRMALLAIFIAESKQRGDLSEAQTARSLGSDTKHVSRYRRESHRVIDAGPKHVDLPLQESSFFFGNVLGGNSSYVPTLVRRVPHARGLARNNFVQPRHHPINVLSEPRVRTSPISVHEHHLVTLHRQRSEETTSRGCKVLATRSGTGNTRHRSFSFLQETTLRRHQAEHKRKGLALFAISGARYQVQQFETCCLLRRTCLLDAQYQIA
mmetsp:Transcript_18951/g.41864  ORF Transcript_18951/g.41864 Transcript_18951/m.41864 type:complete len:260 (+) Transcript_18951:2487-3266(+)